MPTCSVIFVQELTPHDRDARVLQFRGLLGAEYLQFFTASVSGRDLLRISADLDEPSALAALAAEAADRIRDAVTAGTLPTASPEVAVGVDVDLAAVIERARLGELPLLQQGALIAEFDAPALPHSLPAAAARILAEFATRGLGVSATLHPTDFGDAIIWEDGGVRDEDVREALGFLFDEGFLIEHYAAFELTEAGDTLARSSAASLDERA